MKQPFAALSASLAAAALVAIPIAPLQAESADVYKPESDWAIDYGDDYCRLMRDFTNGKDRVGLFIERTQPGPFVRLIVIGDSIGVFRSAQQIGYSMLPSGNTRTTQRLRSKTSDGQEYLNLGPSTLADLPKPAPGTPPAPPPSYTRENEQALAKNITGIALTGGVTKPVAIETGALDAPVQALQVCTDQLVGSWGLDAEAHKTLSRPAVPAGPTAGWITSGIVPFSDFSKLSGGNNEIRVMIDKSGKATSCQAQWPTLSASVNDRICGMVMQNGKFTPALDKSGQPIDSYWITSVFFLTPPFGR